MNVTKIINLKVRKNQWWCTNFNRGRRFEVEVRKCIKIDSLTQSNSERYLLAVFSITCNKIRQNE